MKQAIWKFELEVKEEQTITAPPFIPLTVQVQNGKPCLWAIVAVDMEKGHTPIIMRGTGWEQDDEKLDMATKLRYLGTVQLGSFVWHYFW
jgi:hypothetical protein